MKKVLFLSLFSCSLVISCSKQQSPGTEQFIPENAPLTIQGRNGITVTASDVYSLKSTFKRVIQIKDTEKNVTFPNIYLTFTSKKKLNIYQEMKEHPEMVTGEFTIETEGHVIFKKNIVNGKAQKGLRVPFKVTGTDYMAPCTVTTVHDCVAWEIDDMNWIEYGACLISAPACYATLWASCTWEVCHNGKTYVNPN